MNTIHTTILGMLVWGALLGTAQAQGKMSIEVVGGAEATTPRAPTISNATIRAQEDEGPEVERGAGEVYFKFDEADLTTEVLPLLNRQVGLRVRYRGPARAVTLRLTAPMHWKQALDLIARFSNTHLKRGADGKLELRNRYGGKAEGKYDDLDGQVDLVVERPQRRNVQLPPRNIPMVRLEVMASAPRRTRAGVGATRSAQTSARQANFRQLRQTNFGQPRQNNYRPPRQTQYRPPLQTNYRQPRQTNFGQPRQTSFQQPRQTNFRQPQQTNFR